MKSKFRQYTTYGSIDEEPEDRSSLIKKQMQKDFKLIAHEGLFAEYLEMGWKYIYKKIAIFALTLLL